MFIPSYIQMFKDGELAERARLLHRIYESCLLCPRKCGVNRLRGERGICAAGARAKVCSAHPHFGEEAPLVGIRGSGTIFLSHCNLLCIYCQNWEISHEGEGDEVSDRELASVMVRLQALGCHNLNFVTPTHYLPNIVTALMLAIELGLHIPLVYNTGGYDRVEILRLLDGVFDIYMPDFKYSNEEVAAKYSRDALNYPKVARAAIKEMHRQVGVLKTDHNHIALRGLIIRHLVLPQDLAGTETFLRFVAQDLAPNTYLNIMPQYRPCFRAHNFPELSRRVTQEEFDNAIGLARKYNLTNLD